MQQSERRGRGGRVKRRREERRRAGDETTGLEFGAHLLAKKATRRQDN